MMNMKMSAKKAATAGSAHAEKVTGAASRMNQFDAKTGLAKQAGVGMVEILVTVLVLAIGLMGVVSMQYMSLKSANDAHNRYLAAMYTQELAERMRGNQVAVEAGDYNSESKAGSACTSNCTTRQMAASDIQEWLDNIEADLPNGAGTISAQGPVGKRKFTLTVTWEEVDIYREDDASDVTETSYVLEVTL